MPYWIAKNSYGTVWGEGGYFKIRASGGDDLPDECNIEHEIYTFDLIQDANSDLHPSGGDTLIDNEDNCITIDNQDQSDRDCAGRGDPCDPEPDNPNCGVFPLKGLPAIPTIVLFFVIISTFIMVKKIRI